MELKGKPLTLGAKIAGSIMVLAALFMKCSGYAPNLSMDDVIKAAGFVVAVFLPVDASLLAQNLFGRRE